VAITRSATKTIAIALGCALVLAMGATLVTDGAEGASTTTVHIKDIDFSPHVKKVARGSTVRWAFEDKDTPHNVSSRGTPKFRNSTTRQTGSYTVRFTKQGAYRYVCTIHVNMKGTIVVR